jgi:hypothetical protein
MTTVKLRADAVQIDTQSAMVGGYRLLSNSQVINSDVVTLLPGMPVIAVGPNAIARASAASSGLAAVDGIAFSIAAVATACMMRGQGRIDLSTAEWDAVTGEIGGLFPTARYYLGLVPGTLTSAPPFAIGQSVCLIGKAFSPQSLIIELAPPILL